MTIAEFNNLHQPAIEAMFDYAHRFEPFIWAYPLSLLFTIIAGISFWKSAGSKRLTPLIALFIYSTVGNYFITWKVQTADPNMPAWYYPFWQWVGPEPIPGLVFLDILFYIATMFLTVAVVNFFIKKESSVRDFKKSTQIGWILWTTLAMSSIVMLTCTRLFGQINTLYYAFPAMILTAYLIARGALHTKLFLIYLLSMDLFCLVWDFALVNLFPMLGFKWGVSWTYVLETGGHIMHSNVFMDKNLYPWMWLRNTPLEVCVDMTVKGCWFAWALIKTIQLTVDDSEKNRRRV